MNNCKTCIIDERSKNIPIPKNSPTKKNEVSSLKEYSLTQNFFDPSKSSPPNEFMLKLKLRMSHYDSFNNLESLTNE